MSPCFKKLHKLPRVPFGLNDVPLKAYSITSRNAAPPSITSTTAPGPTVGPDEKLHFVARDILRRFRLRTYKNAKSQEYLQAWEATETCRDFLGESVRCLDGSKWIGKKGLKSIQPLLAALLLQSALGSFKARYSMELGKVFRQAPHADAYECMKVHFQTHRPCTHAYMNAYMCMIHWT